MKPDTSPRQVVLRNIYGHYAWHPVARVVTYTLTGHKVRGIEVGSLTSDKNSAEDALDIAVKHMLKVMEDR